MGQASPPSHELFWSFGANNKTHKRLASRIRVADVYSPFVDGERRSFVFPRQMKKPGDAWRCARGARPARPPRRHPPPPFVKTLYCRSTDAVFKARTRIYTAAGKVRRFSFIYNAAGFGFIITSPAPSRVAARESHRWKNMRRCQHDAAWIHLHPLLEPGGTTPLPHPFPVVELVPF